MREITVYGYDGDNIRSVLKELKKTYRVVDSIEQIEKTKWLLVNEKEFLNENEALFALGYDIIVICKSVTQVKVKKFFRMGIKDYILAPIIKEEFLRKLGYYEVEASKLELDRRLLLTTEVASIGAWDYDIVSDDLIWDDNMFEIHHLPIDTRIYKMVHWTSLIHPDDKEIIDQSIQNALDHTFKLDLTYRVIHKEDIHYIRTNGVVLLKDDIPIGLTGTSIDVTDQVLVKDEKNFLESKYNKKNEEMKKLYGSLELTRERMETTLMFADVGYWEWFVDEDRSYENEQWFKMLGYDKKTFEYNDEWFYGLMHEEDLVFMSEKLNRMAAGFEDQLNEEFRLKNKNGQWSWILARGQTLEHTKAGTAKTVSGVHINITQVKESEKQLNLLSKAVETSPVGIVITDSYGLIDYVNPAFEVMTGYSLLESVGEKTSILKSTYHDDAFYDDLWQTVSHGETWKGVFYNKKKSGECYWESAVISPMFDEFHNIVSYVGVKEDITIEKERENEMVVRNKRLTRQQWILQSLTQNNEIRISDLSVSLKVISEAVASGLEVNSCSICFFDEMNTFLKCRYHYMASNPVEKNELPLKLIDYRDYFETILAGSQVILSTYELSEHKKIYNYLISNNIYASIHVPIWFRGEVIGLVKAEQESVYRNWVPDEISFLRAISDLLTITLETKERIKAQNSAEEATRVKSDFLANMSHEIRTPMNAVIGLTHLALKTDLTKKQEDYLKKINEAAKHLLVLINDILDFSKVEAGKIILENVVFSVESITAHVTNMVSEKIIEKGIDFSVEVGESVPDYLKGDPYRLGQVLLNLVSNAIKFTEKGYVKVILERVYSDENNDDYIMLQFTVKDTGIGITETAKGKLFDHFEQGDTSITRRFGGTGLGLAISKELVKLFGGDIWVESVLNEGSEFIFTANFMTSKDDEVVLEPEFVTSIRDKGSYNTILVAEDNKINQQIIREFLEPYGLDAYCVSNGREAIDYLVSGNPCALVLMDIQMPVLDGYEATSHIRSLSVYDHIPIIAISADARPDVKIKAINCGMNDFITKPIDQKILAKTVLRWIGQEPFKLHIENIDTELGLFKCNGNESLYVNVLRKMVEDHNSDLLFVKESIIKKQGSEARLLHTLKGLAGQIGASSFFEKMEELEDYIVNRKRGYKNKLDVLTREYKTMLQSVEDALSGYEDVTSDKLQDDKSFVELLMTLYKPLSNGYVNQIKLIISQLDTYKANEAIEVNYNLMCKQIKRYQFGIAGESLSKIIQEMEVRLG